ncbi:MAG: hypothetical protein EXS55_04925 [Candidatus Magasanikbacteria bacterium]|nr:hypothetical protein [Candidatus Magasanikbacteria bacterium]
MFFNRKKSALPAEDKPRLSVQTIPADFYAGKNPVITFKTIAKEVDLNKVSRESLSDRHKVALDKATAAGHSGPLHPVRLLSNRKVLAMIFVAIFIVGVAGASVYFWKIARPRPPALVVAPVVAPISEPVAPPPAEPIVPVAEVTSTPPLVSKSLGGGDLELPSLFIPDSADSDTDGLSDVEEELYKTNPAVLDSDGDKYTDSHEVFNLYNPAGQEPEKIIDSGMVKDFHNPTFGYDMYYPASWALGIVDQTDRDVLVSTITGENIEIRVVDKILGQSFADWFGDWAPREQFSDLIPFTSRFKESGWRRSDYLVYYFDDGARVFVIAYHTTTENVVNYRTVIKMLARSFRLNGNTAIIPTRPVELGSDSVGLFSVTSSLSTIASSTPAATGTRPRL